MNFPQVHVAGDTLDFEVSVPDYPSSDGWTLKYYLTPRFAAPTQAQIVITAIANADGTYQVQASPTDTAAWKTGAYGWARIVSKTGARQTLTGSEDQGEVLVRPDPAAAAQGADTRSHAYKVLEAIEAVIERRASSDQQRVTHNDMELQYIPITDLLVLRDRYRAEVQALDAAAVVAAGGAHPKVARIRFSQA